ncbi:MAG: hypothetical protein M3069_20020 [Chloroflexota bacterium]|nr:hypothetical protein [Chloroflexota bacterium]
MANTNTATSTMASAAVDEAVRIAADSSRRTLDTAQATVAAGQRYLDLASQMNRDVFSLWATAAETSLRTAFEVQNAALTSGQSLFEASAKLSNDALRRWVEVARQAQATTLKNYQSTTKLLGTLTHE